MEAEKAFPPAWFKIENYRDSKDFDASQWYEQLSRRQAFFLYNEYEPGARLEGDIADRLWRLETAKKAVDIRQNPLKSVPVQGLSVPESAPISNLKVSDLMRQADRDRDARKFGLSGSDATRRWRVIRNPQASFEDHRRLSETKISIDFYDIRKSPLSVIQVDLGASTEVLKAHFERWLKDERARVAGIELTDSPVAVEQSKTQARSSKSRTRLYDRWTKYGVLPYLDLAIWVMEKDIEVTAEMYADAICDGYRRGEGNFRKTTRPLASQLMRDLSKLRALVGYEA